MASISNPIPGSFSGVDEEFLGRESGIHSRSIHRNVSPAVLYEEALKYEEGTFVTSTGALVTWSGAKTGRSPSDKRIVDMPDSTNDVWWGPVNMKMTEHVFHINRERAVDYLNTRPRLYVFDGFAGWDTRHRIKIRVICARAYHGTNIQTDTTILSMLASPKHRCQYSTLDRHAAN